ncbi:MAG: hypothetical protein ACO38V_12620, partial [Phycisphaerales bacterium]
MTHRETIAGLPETAIVTRSGGGQHRGFRRGVRRVHDGSTNAGKASIATEPTPRDSPAPTIVEIERAPDRAPGEASPPDPTMERVRRIFLEIRGRSESEIERRLGEESADATVTTLVRVL